MTNVLGPGIRTYKPRRSRIRARELAAIDESPWLVRSEPSQVQIDELFDNERELVVEIGFGLGGATAAMAATTPEVGVIAIDVHTPGVGNLLYLLDREGLTNVRVLEGDALPFLATSVPVGRLSGLRTYFPDPWPKVRHHKRRLIQDKVIDLVQQRLQPGGTWHIATDWADYVDVIEAAFGDRPGWSGGPIERPPWRPVTHYETRALREGRSITDLMYRTVPSA